MNKQTNINHIKQISRRSFIFGGAAAFASASILLAGCKSKKNENVSVDKSKELAPITAAVPCSINSLNPVGQTNPIALSANWHVLEGLYEIDFRTYKTYYGLAALAPKKINDLTYEVILRDEAKFSDGTDVSSKDVVESFNRNMQDPFYSSLLNFIESVSAKNEKTVRFKLRFAFEALLQERLSIVKIVPANITDQELLLAPVGSGPWKYKNTDNNENGHVEFEPNLYYNGRYPSKSPSMEWIVNKNFESRADEACQGHVLTILDAPTKQEKKLKDSGMNVDYAKGSNQAFLMFNTNKAPFDNYKVRQAFFYALDVNKLIDASCSSHGAVAQSVLPKDNVSFHKASTNYTYDLQKARQLLKEANCEELSLTLRVDSGWVSSLSSQIKDSLGEAGIQCRIDEQDIDWDTFSSLRSAPVFDVILSFMDTSCLGNDADALISWWYDSDVWMKERTGWKISDAEQYNKLHHLIQTAREANSSKKQMHWDECQEIIAKYVPIYPLFFREVATSYNQKNIINFKPTLSYGLCFLEASAVK